MFLNDSLNAGDVVLNFNPMPESSRFHFSSNSLEMNSNFACFDLLPNGKLIFRHFKNASDRLVFPIRINDNLMETTYESIVYVNTQVSKKF